MLIGRLIKQANNAMNQEMNSFAQQYGLTGMQMSIIDFLTHFPGNSCDQHQIENEFGIKRSTTTVLLQRMAKKNLIERHPLPEDRRQKVVTLTAEGKKLSSDVSAYITQYEEKLKADFSEQDISKIKQFLLTMIEGKNEYEY